MRRTAAWLALALLMTGLGACEGGGWPRLAGPPPHSPAQAPEPMRRIDETPVLHFASPSEAEKFLAELPSALARWEHEIEALSSASSPSQAAAGRDWAEDELKRAARHRLRVDMSKAELKLDAAERALPGEALTIARLRARLARLKAALAAIG